MDETAQAIDQLTESIESIDRDLNGINEQHDVSEEERTAM